MVRTPHVRPLALGVAALLCAACSGSGGGAAHATATGRPAVAGAPGAQSGQSGSPSGGGAAAARGGATGSPGSGGHGGGSGGAVHPATASGPAAAAPGTYPITGTYSASSTTQPSPSQTSGAGTLTIAAAQSTSAGSEQDQTYHYGSDDLAIHQVYAAGGEVLVSRSGSADFSPTLPIVPAGLHDGMSWGPVSFTSSGASGTLTGSAGQTTQATVGGVAVTVVPITLHIQLSGSFHNTPYTATSVETMSWAPALHMAVHLHMATDARYAAAGTYHSDLDVSLLSTRPQ